MDSRLHGNDRGSKNYPTGFTPLNAFGNPPTGGLFNGVNYSTRLNAWIPVFLLRQLLRYLLRLKLRRSRKLRSSRRLRRTSRGNDRGSKNYPTGL